MEDCFGGPVFQILFSGDSETVAARRKNTIVELPAILLLLSLDFLKPTQSFEI